MAMEWDRNEGLRIQAVEVRWDERKEAMMMVDRCDREWKEEEEGGNKRRGTGVIFRFLVWLGGNVNLLPTRISFN